MIGKWHLGFCNKKFWPNRRGFDSFYGFLGGSEDYFSHSKAKGYDFREGDEVAWEANSTYSTFLLQSRAQQIIRSHNKEQS